MGLSELRACQSLLEQALAHLLKLHVLPQSQAAKHWRDEIRAFLHDAQRRFTPSMRQRIGLDDLYSKAAGRARAAAEDAGATADPVPDACPFTLEELLSADIAVLSSKLRSSATCAGSEQEDQL